MQWALVSTIESERFVRLFDSEEEATQRAAEWICASDGPLAGNPSERAALEHLGPAECLYDFQDSLGASEWLFVESAT